MFVCLANDVELYGHLNSGHLSLIKWDAFYNSNSREWTTFEMRWTWEQEASGLPPMLNHTCALPGYL